VPFSTFAMVRYLEDNGRRLGCIGADSWGQTPHRQFATPYLYSVADCRVESVNLVAWTQYGIFRREVFEAGVRFDENGPFGGPGWGFEDNDLAFQMLAKRYMIQGFLGMVYLHRTKGSSVKIMRATGIEADAIFERRRQFIMDKWSDVPSISRGPLAILQKTEFQHQ